MFRDKKIIKHEIFLICVEKHIMIITAKHY